MPSGRFSVRRFLFRSFLVLIAAYLIWDRIEAARLSREIAAIAARGEPVHDDEAIPRPRTPEQIEASRLYAQAAGLAFDQSAEDNNRASRLDVDRPGGTELSLADMVAAYRDDASPLQLLDRATPLDFGGFREEDRLPAGSEMSLSALASLACLRADLASARGDGDAAAAALVPCVRVQRTLNSMWGRSAHAARVLGDLRILVRHTHPSDAALAVLKQTFDAWPDEDVALQSVLQERAHFIDIAEGGMRGYLPPLVRIGFHPFVLRSARLGIASFEPAVRLARLPWAARSEAAAEIRRTATRTIPRGQRSFFFAMLDPFPMGYVGLAMSQAGQELAARRVAVAVIAVERFRRAHAGSPPASLDDLVPAFIAAVPQDPLSLKPLVYRRDPDGYVIYSVDANRKDDGGEFYGHGSTVTKHVGPQSPRDLGIHVPLTPQRH